MNTEFEATFIDIDVDKVRQKLKQLNATLLKPETLMKRVVFEPPQYIEGGWLRVRDEGDKITLSVKQVTGTQIDDQKEVELIIHDFDTGIQFLVVTGVCYRGETPVTKEVDKLFSRIFLYQIFSEYIRGSAIIPLIGRDLRFSDYIQSLDTKDGFQKRIKFINWIINNDNYKYVAGALGDICSFINKNT